MELEKKIRQLMHNHKVINLAYVDDLGQPQACALWYASTDNMKIYFLSSLETRHGRSLKEGGRCAFTINQDDQQWQSIIGLQGRGVVKINQDENGWREYITKYPFVTKQFDNLDTAMIETRLWEISPSWLRIIDNTVKFGYKEELDLVGDKMTNKSKIITFEE